MTGKGKQIGNSREEMPPFRELLQKLMREGVRPTGKPGVAGKPWTNKDLADAVGGKSTRAVGYWRRGKHVPEDPISLEAAFFGSKSDWDAERKRFRAAHEAAAKHNKVNPDLQTRVVAPQRFVGREMEIAALHQAITHLGAVAVVGPPGIGKTALVRQVASSREVIERFGQRRWDVDLEATNNAVAMQDAIIAAIGFDPRAASLSGVLNRIGRQASLLVLDNLETPWERDTKAVQDCLCKLAMFPAIKLIVSLRGSMAPTAPVFGQLIKVGPLPSARAKELFLALAPDISPDDPYLNPLLDAFHGMPLAIELIAYQAAPFKTLQSIWNAWQQIGLGLATHPDQSGGRYTCILRSIGLSWRSPRLKQEGQRLFRMLGQLPGGMRGPDVTALMGNEAHHATRQLLATGLAFESRTGRIDLLPPIRAFARALSALEPDYAQELTNYYLPRGNDLISRLDTDTCLQSPEWLDEDIKNIISLKLYNDGIETREVTLLEAVSPANGQLVLRPSCILTTEERVLMLFILKFLMMSYPITTVSGGKVSISAVLSSTSIKCTIETTIEQITAV